MKVLKWLDENIERYVCVLLFSAIITLMIINVFMRFVVRSALPWASEAVLFMFIWFVWFCISLGFKERNHVRVTAITDLFPEKVRKILDIAINILIIASFSILFIFGIALVTDNSVVGKTGLLIKYPMWLVYVSTPIGVGLSIFRVIQNVLKDINNIKTGRSS